MTEADLLKAAEGTDAKADEQPHCQAYFYMGAKRLLVGDKVMARDCFETCIATRQQAFAEYQSAVAELKVLKVEK